MKHRRSSAVSHRTKGIVTLMRRMRGARSWFGGGPDTLKSWSKIEGCRDFDHDSQDEYKTIEPCA
jgi:hypothetical protein